MSTDINIPAEYEPRFFSQYLGAHFITTTTSPGVHHWYICKLGRLPLSAVVGGPVVMIYAMYTSAVLYFKKGLRGSFKYL